MSSEASAQILDKMLGSLGFEAEVAVEESDQGVCLQIQSPDSKYIIGQKGDRLDDIQYLVNRVMQNQDPDSERVKVDCDQYRTETETRLKEKVLRYAEEVKESGKPKRLQPLNAYYRRLVHNYLVDDNEIETSSPHGSSRFKKITISLK